MNTLQKEINTQSIMNANIQVFKNIVKSLESKKRILEYDSHNPDNPQDIDLIMCQIINLDYRIQGYEEKIFKMESGFKK